MIVGYQYQSAFARKYYSQGLKEGRQKALERLRGAIVERVCTRLPRLHDELASRLRDQPEELLVRLAMELGNPSDEDEARAVLDRVLGPQQPVRRKRPATSTSARSTKRRKA